MATFSIEEHPDISGLLSLPHCGPVGKIINAWGIWVIYAHFNGFGSGIISWMVLKGERWHHRQL
jgi:hypothetical protein